MKCRDCCHRGWGDDEGTPVYGFCIMRGSCPDPDIERSCPDFTPKGPSMLQQLQADNEALRKEVEWKDNVLQLTQRELQKAKAELEQMAACVYYRPGGLCRYGGDDPANICVFGPCPHARSAQEEALK